jgi:outer membrane protein OmpA-like peptidoglycan-associated protein
LIRVEKAATTPDFTDYSLVIHFDYNMYNIKGMYLPQLNSLADTLKKYPDLNVDISGHTDGCGPDRGNLLLSEKRAATIKSYLTNLHIPANRITYQAYGESKLLYPDNAGYDAVNAAKNRRCEIKIAARK